MSNAVARFVRPFAAHQDIATGFVTPSSYADPATVHEDLARLRGKNPIAWVETANLKPARLITRTVTLIDSQTELLRNSQVRRCSDPSALARELTRLYDPNHRGRCLMAAAIAEPMLLWTPDVPVPKDKAAFDAAIVDPDSYAHEERYHAIFSHLRQEAPVYWCEPEGYRPFWTVARHADIRRVELDAVTFLNDPRLTLSPIKDEERVRQMTGGSDKLTRNLVSMDNPDHRHFRAMTQGYFGAKQMRRLENEIRTLARRSVDHMAALDRACDFAAEVAIWFPLRVIMMTLGAGPEDEAFLMKVTQEVFGASDREHMRPEEMGGLFATIAEFNAWCDRITADRRINPRDDVSTIIANATLPDGSPMGNMEAMSYYLIIAAAGHDTTSSSASAGLLELIRNPDELAKLRADPTLLSNAIDEMIRWSSPVKHFFRTAAVDTEVAGVPIRAGDGLVMAYPSANRDSAVFDNPFAFRIDRANAREHLAFGYGPHLCLGQHLAKLEMRILFEELLARFDGFALDGTPEWSRASFVSGLKHLPIRYRAR